MMGGVERFVVEDGESASGEGADEERAEKTGGVGDGDSIDIGDLELGFFKRLVDDGEDSLDVRASGDFGDYAAVSLVNIDLGNYDVAQNMGTILNDGSRSFITTGLDAEDFHEV